MSDEAGSARVSGIPKGACRLEQVVERLNSLAGSVFINGGARVYKGERSAEGECLAQAAALLTSMAQELAEAKAKRDDAATNDPSGYVSLFDIGFGTPDPLACEWPAGVAFGFIDEPGEHDPCYVIMPGGAALPFNHHAGEGVDVARARFVQTACNAALARTDILRHLNEALGDAQVRASAAEAELASERAHRLVAEQNLREAIKECAGWAREAGEAKGRLEMSEAAGIVDGWRERAEKAEAERDEAFRLADEAQHAWLDPKPWMERATVAEAKLSEAVKGLEEALDLLLERKQGSPARSAGHNAWLAMETTLSSIRAPASEGGEG